MGLMQDRDFDVSFEGRAFTFQLDFARPLDWESYRVTGFSNCGNKYDLDVEVDGRDYHSSDIQRRKDNWKDGIKVAHGLKVIHIPAEICERKWWDYLDSEYTKALESVEGAIYIDA